MENDILGNKLQDKQTQGSSVVERRTHNPEAGGATPPPATTNPDDEKIVLGYN